MHTYRPLQVDWGTAAELKFTHANIICSPLYYGISLAIKNYILLICTPYLIGDVTKVLGLVYTSNTFDTSVTLCIVGNDYNQQEAHLRQQVIHSSTWYTRIFPFEPLSHNSNSTVLLLCQGDAGDSKTPTTRIKYPYFSAKVRTSIAHILAICACIHNHCDDIVKYNDIVPQYVGANKV